jgi:hypothetical protein
MISNLWKSSSSIPEETLTANAPSKRGRLTITPSVTSKGVALMKMVSNHDI